MDEKVERLITALMRDELGEWSYDQESDTFSRKLGLGRVTLRREENVGDVGFVLCIYNSENALVEMESGWMGPDYMILANLYETISRRFLGVDELLDSMLAELASSEYDPFREDPDA